MSNTNFKTSLLLGLGAGFAAGYFLNSKKGKEMQKQAADFTNDTIERAKLKSDEILNTTADEIEMLKKKGIETLNKVQNKSNAATDDAKSYIDSEIAKLKKKLEQKNGIAV